MSNSKKIEALAKFLECKNDTICRLSDTAYSFDNEVYKVLTEEEINQQWQDDLEAWITNTVAIEIQDDPTFKAEINDIDRQDWYKEIADTNEVEVADYIIQYMD